MVVEMNRYFYLLAFIISLCIIFITCQNWFINNKWNCNQLLATPLHFYLQQTIINYDAFIQEIMKLYGIPYQKLNIQTRKENGWSITWTYKNINYIALSTEGIKLDMIGSEYQYPRFAIRPTAQELIDCVGIQPEAYWAVYGPNYPARGVRYVFGMYFPSHGIVAVATGANQRSAVPPSLNSDILISRTIVFAPAPLPALYERYRGITLEEARPSLRPRPWLGWENARFVEDREAGW